ncbi:ketoacyl-synt-domain-containing protein [Massarina eburnea CBS 473.64]|uniref:Ketoacyl-synt-domain-containing protein n=1 Tax=Massarina eburnea CBS 473.64 TaxID=1395130 RepID=A0A6A6RS49_9PLEO|nr:ketoacyl-synt-domain-containing protein [Massarina eburnea CBS 473.64]
MADTNEYEPLAIVGLAFRFPGDADTPEGFWKMMEQRRCAMTEIPSERINIDAFYHDDNSRVDTLNLRGGHFMKGALGAFDNAFFSIGPLEASAMDPQQRGMLETSYHALENAGIPLKALAGSKTAVFTASFSDDHRMLNLNDPELLSPYTGSATAWSILANRLSWWYDLKGPSVHVDTACSGGLVALHLACQSLRNGETSMALVGGSNIMSSVEQFLFMSNLSMLSPSSRSYSFDHRANGYARGEGFGFVVVKKLSDALSNGDTIRAVIRATGVNQDGRTPSLTSPSQDAQETLIRDTYRIAGLDPKDTDYVEAHGTGTPVGDPIEARALGAVFGASRPTNDPVIIGAVKSNIGHLEGGSGLAALIKAILSLERGVIPPNANFEKLNPSIDADALNIKFPTESIPWPSSIARRASVNCFGFGGTNAHVVLDDACNFLQLHNLHGYHLSFDTTWRHSISDSRPGTRPGTPLTPSSSGDLETGHTQSLPRLLTWSAHDEKGIHRVAQNLQQFFSKNVHKNDTAFALDALAYTLAGRRTQLHTRSFAVVDCQKDLSQLSKIASSPTKAQRARSTCFVFTGQGAQYSRMGIQLLQYPTFRQSMENADVWLGELGCEWSLLEEIAKAESDTRVNEPELSQPICTALQIALVDQLASFGITPSTVVGHSSGEIAAAYAMGALSAKAAVKVSYLRGKTAAQLTTAPTRGAMMAVGLSERETAVYLDQYRKEHPLSQIVVACNNSPNSVTLAGDADAIEVLRTRFDQDGMFARKLKISVAYHSPHVEQFSPLYRTLLGSLESEGRRIEGNCAMISSVTGQQLDRSQAATPEYWVKNLESPVRFCEALSGAINLHATTRREGNDLMSPMEPLDLLEIGPHCALKGPIKSIMASFEDAKFMRYDTVMDRYSDPAGALLNAVGRLHCLGHPVNLLAANGIQDKSHQMVDGLPPYPFDHSMAHQQRNRAYKPLSLRKEARSDLLGLPMFVDGPPQMTRRWRKFIKTSETPWVRDHVASGSILYPGAGMLCMAIEAAKRTAEPKRKVKAYRLTNVELHQALPVPDDRDGVESQFELTPVHVDTKYVSEYGFRLCSNLEGTWVQNCVGNIRIEYAVEGQDTFLQSSYDVSSCTRNVDSTTLYNVFDTMGLKFGTTFRSLSDVAIGSQDDACATVEAFPWTASASVQTQEHVIHPITLDGIFQLVLGALVEGGKRRAPTTVPTRLEELYVDGSGAAAPQVPSLKTYAKVAERTSVTTTSSASAWNANGRIIVSVIGLETTFVDSLVDDIEHIESVPEEILCHKLLWKPDIDSLSYDKTPLHLQRSLPEAEVKEHYTSMSRSFSLLCAQILKSFDINSLPLTRPHLKTHFQWMQSFASKVSASDLEAALLQGDTVPGLSDKIAQESVDGRGLTLAAQYLQGILSGSVDPVETVFKSSWAEQYYQMLNMHAQKRLQHVIELIAFKNPGLKVLEIGAGTGSTTEHILECAISQGWGLGGKPASAITTYDFTDISPAFFPAAKTKFENADPTMNFLVLDVSEDPLAQGFKTHSYDLIVAANVLHATANLDSTITNVRKLLKKGGKLVLFEITANQWLPQIMFGTLPGWWLGNDEYRTAGPCIPHEAWNTVLQKNGFSGTDIVLHDSNDAECRMCSVMVATAVSDELVSMRGPAISIIIGATDSAAFVFATKLRKELGNTIADVEVLALQQASTRDLSNRVVLSLLEFTDPFLATVDETNFTALQTLLIRAANVLWVRSTGSGRPDWQLSDGLLRVLRSENTGTKYVSYAISESTETSQQLKTIVRLIQRFSSGDVEVELELQDREGNLCISRAMPATKVNGHIASMASLVPTKESSTQQRHLNSVGDISCTLSPNATYLIVGGFGGLARCIAEWMARRGARHLLLLSRSGPSTAAAKGLVSRLSTQGVHVECPTCDIADSLQVHSVIAACASKMPPIKGCIQGALVLRDSVFERMTYRQWMTTVSTRVQGTQNLRTVLPRAMDFFILLSSVNGLLGSISQANYAATNTYLDGFADYYTTPESPIISLDLGWMNFAGTVAESKAITQRMAETKCARPVTENEMLGFLDYYCDRERIRSATTRHVSIGIQAQGTRASWKHGYLDRPIWKHMLHAASVQESAATTTFPPSPAEPEKKKLVNISSQLSKAISVAEAHNVSVQGLRWKIATDLGIPEDDVDPSKPLHEVGVDSLLAVQIKTWVREEMGADISVFDIMGTKSMSQLCLQMVSKSKLVAVGG